MLGLRLVAVALLLLFATAFTGRAEPAVPRLTGAVVDLAGILTPGSEAELTRQLESVRNRTGAQMVIATIPDLGPYSIESWGITLGRGWKIGRVGKDDGVIILVAPNDREVRIEVGYGLEGDIPDARAHGIVTQILLPAFRNGDYARGLKDAVDALEKLIVDPNASAPTRPAHGNLYVVLIFVFGVLVLMTIGVAVSLHGWNSAGSTRNRPDDDDDSPWWASSSSSNSSSSSYSSYRGGGGAFGGGGASGKW